MRFFKRHKLLTIILVILSLFIYINYTSMLEVSVDRTSKYYTNDIYISDQRIYNNYLDEYEKKAYDELLNAIKLRKKHIKVNLNEYSNKDSSTIAGYFNTANRAMMLDHPELLQYGYISYGYGDNRVNVSIHYSIDNPIVEEINTLKIRKIINDIRLRTINMTDKEKIKYVYEWIGDNTRYDYTFTYMAKNQSIYNVFIKGNAVCAGFAKASQVIFQNIGIESMTAEGDTTGPHMWNIIKYNGKYYFYDSTVAACRKKGTEGFYDGLKQVEMKDHELNNSEWYPKIEEVNALYE